jgi:hypothetical protein
MAFLKNFDFNLLLDKENLWIRLSNEEGKFFKAAVVFRWKCLLKFKAIIIIIGRKAPIKAVIFKRVNKIPASFFQLKKFNFPLRRSFFPYLFKCSAAVSPES